MDVPVRRAHQERLQHASSAASTTGCQRQPERVRPLQPAGRHHQRGAAVSRPAIRASANADRQHRRSRSATTPCSARALVNSFRYGLTRIDTRRRSASSSRTTRRLPLHRPARCPTRSRPRARRPTHNIVNDLSWLQGQAHGQGRERTCGSRAFPRTRDSDSWLTATVNPSWVDGVGRTFTPGRANCSTPGCSQVPAVASGFAAGYADSWLNILGVLSQANLVGELRP